MAKSEYCVASRDSSVVKRVLGELRRTSVLLRRRGSKSSGCGKSGKRAGKANVDDASGWEAKEAIVRAATQPTNQLSGLRVAVQENARREDLVKLAGLAARTGDTAKVVDVERRGAVSGMTAGVLDSGV